MLQVRNLSFDDVEHSVLQQIDFSIKSGCLLHVKGENGAGKTTLLKLLAGLLHPLEGGIICQESVCYLGHQNGVNMRLTPEEHIRFDLGVHDFKKADEMLAYFNLDAVRDRPCGLLSAGQKRRVGLLRLLATDAKLWLLDEPLVGLDEVNTKALGACLKAHLQHKGSVILTAHHTLPFTLDSNVYQVLML